MSSQDLEPTQGYYRFPTVADDRVVFVSEDDLWDVPLAGGVARRLTTGLGEATHPVFSPDGRWLAFSGEDEGVTEVYVMPARGGVPRRLSFDGHLARVVGWTRDSARVLYSSDAHQPFARLRTLFAVGLDGGEPQRLPVGPAHFVSYAEGNRAVLCRMQDDSAYWKRYRGGTTGIVWVDRSGDGQFTKLLDLQGNLVRPLWVGDRIFVVSDHEGVANLYSCDPDGADLQRHTDHHFYVRHPHSDGVHIVYHAGGDVWAFHIGSGETRRIDIEFASPRPQRARRFVTAPEYLEDYDLHPDGHSVLVTARGTVSALGHWEGPVHRIGSSSRRLRLARYFDDGKRAVLVSDEGGEEHLEVHDLVGVSPVRRLADTGDSNVGRPIELLVSPEDDFVALTNHRHELVVVDLEHGNVRVLDRSRFARIQGLSWSPDGRYLAYGLAESAHTVCIKIVCVESGESHCITASEFRDVEPAFDPKGRYLYFLSYRDFDPVYDTQSFDLGFPEGMCLCLVTLRKDLPSPFVPVPRPLDGKSKDDKDDKEKAGKQKPTQSDKPAETVGPGNPADDKPADPPADDEDRVVIDFDGITERALLFPLGSGRFGRIAGADERVFFTAFPIQGTLDSDWDDSEPDEDGTLHVFNLEDLELSTVMDGVDDFLVGADDKTLLVRAGHRLRVLETSHTDDKDDEGSSPSRKSGWLDLARIAIEVVPGAEWRQMLHEAWRLMRDHFWSEDMSGVRWDEVVQRYAPLVDRAGSRAELSDLIWEMQGELGTSHAYEFGGDYRQPPCYPPGLLAADVHWDEERAGFHIDRIVRGDAWDTRASSPLARPGVDVRVGDVITAVDGAALDGRQPLQASLINKAGREVALSLAPRTAGDSHRSVVVRALRSEGRARYRDWVRGNRTVVHQASDGRVGYVHVPNMAPTGFSEFFRGYLAEVSRDALIVDVRFNGGGHVSPLLLEKLARRRLGYDVQRWGEPFPYPPESVLGPIVALTNEHAGSDGDIFCHCFKLMNLGTLVGKRTWGGVIGIWPRHSLVDGTTTSQPEFAFWFQDVGFGVENYGTEPDIEVEITPQDYASGRDPQLARAITVAQELMAKRPPTIPDFGARPDRAAPWQRGPGQR